MRAVSVRPGEPGSVELIEVDTPVPGDGEVLVKVVRIGVCATDREIIAAEYGEAPPGEDRLILGHESLGRVAELGPGEHGLEPGDYVVSSVRRPCPHERCAPCRADSNDLCVTGDFSERGIDGAHGFNAEYFADHERWLTKIPPEIAGIAVLLEPMTIVEKALRHARLIQRRLPWSLDWAAVLGAGPVGLLGAALLRLSGADTWVADRTGPDSPKGRLTGRIGATHVNIAGADLESAVGLDRGFDLILEATGFSPLVFTSAAALAPNGVFCLLGVSGGSRKIEVDSDAFNQMFVLGNRLLFGSVNANLTDFRAGVQHLAQIENAWPGWLSSLITRRVPVEEYGQAFQRRPDDIKVTVEYQP